MEKCFYVRVTNVTNQTALGLVGMSTDLKYFLDRIRKQFPESDYQVDDAHLLAPLEVRCVHPECKGVLDDLSSSLMVSLNKPLQI